jgi:hypothetical protein
MSVASVPPPPLPPAPPQPAGKQAVTAFVLGILGLACCPLFGPFAWYMGKQEQAAIAQGLSPASGEGMAKAAFVLGILGSIYMAGAVLWVFFMGGLAFISAAFNH